MPKEYRPAGKISRKAASTYNRPDEVAKVEEAVRNALARDPTASDEEINEYLWLKRIDTSSIDINGVRSAWEDEIATRQPRLPSNVDVNAIIDEARKQKGTERRLSDTVIRAVAFSTFEKAKQKEAVKLVKSLSLLEKGVNAWNEYRACHPGFKPYLADQDLSWIGEHVHDLSGINLSGANLDDADMTGQALFGANLKRASLRNACLVDVGLEDAELDYADLSGADLSDSNLTKASFFRATLRGASLFQADLDFAHFQDACLDGACLDDCRGQSTIFLNANLQGARFKSSELEGAELSGADLQGASLINTNLSYANLNGCSVHGVAAWNVCLEGALQDNLIVNHEYENRITVDNLEVAQFIYLLLRNEKIRGVIDTITSKLVLILGRFTKDRKEILDALRIELRKHDLLPVLFDFDVPSSRDTEETVSALARLARFIIADITDPKSIPQELATIVPALPSVPVQPILQANEKIFGMYDHISRYPWVLAVHRYRGKADLLRSLENKVLRPAENAFAETHRLRDRDA
jgi:uncharacterized protein YjbI with pentapeptide repeats